MLIRSSLALLTDLYQLTMAYGYWKLGRAERQTVFQLFFRKPPFSGSYAIAAGLGTVIEYLESFKFDSSDTQYLSTLTGNDGQPLFDSEFLAYLETLQLSVDIDAVPEGTLVFGHEPILRVRGPILQCQILETALLNIVNFQTLIATKASRICTAAQGEPVLEFGLRRAQGIDGGLSSSRAAFIGGCAATSNVLAGKVLGIPVRGTHAHSWVMSFDDEEEAFENYADAMPNNCVFLVDTYDTIEGVHRAANVGKRLRQRGHEMVGIRLDSGDLAYLSIEARKILDAAGFKEAVIVASNDLDEWIIESLKSQGAKISVWGVGTKMATAFDQPALGGVYKLAAMMDDHGKWQPKIKLSEQAVKTSIPGIQQIRRFESKDGMVADMIYDEGVGVDPRLLIVDPHNSNRKQSLTPDLEGTDLLVNVFRKGQTTLRSNDLENARKLALAGLEKLHLTSRRLLNPHHYVVGLDVGLNELRDRMIRRSEI